MKTTEIEEKENKKPEYTMTPSDRTAIYQIRIEGHVREDWFEGLDVKPLPNGETLISGFMDQAALHGLLCRIRDLGLVLISIQIKHHKKGLSK